METITALHRRLRLSRRGLRAAERVCLALDAEDICDAMQHGQSIRGIAWIGAAIMAIRGWLDAQRAWTLVPIAERFPSETEIQLHSDVVLVRYYRSTTDAEDRETQEGIHA